MTDRAIVAASTVNCRTMADDTLRVTFDIEPGDAQSAFAMFGSRGTSVAIAVLTDEAAKDDMQTKAAKPYGEFAKHLYAKGFFDNLQLKTLLDVPHDADRDATKEAFKRAMSSNLVEYRSLAAIPPALIIAWSQMKGIVFTFPRID